MAWSPQGAMQPNLEAATGLASASRGSMRRSFPLSATATIPCWETRRTVRCGQAQAAADWPAIYERQGTLGKGQPTGSNGRLARLAFALAPVDWGVERLMEGAGKRLAVH